MGGNHREGLVHYGKDLGDGIRLADVEEDGGDPAEGLAAAVEGRYGVLEVRSGLIGDDGLYLGSLLLDSGLDGGNVVADLDLVERRNSIRGIPFGEERVGGACASCHCECRSRGDYQFLHYSYRGLCVSE